MSKHNAHLTVFTCLALAFFATLSNTPIQRSASAKAHSGLHYTVHLSGLCIICQEPTQHPSPSGDLAQNHLPTGVSHVIVSARINVSGDLASSPKHKNDSCERYPMLKNMQNC